MDLLETKHDTDHKKRVKDESECPNQTSVQSFEHPEQNHIHSLAAPSEGAKTENLCPSRPRGEQEVEESEREETESSDDNTTQYSIHPPHDCPYLLLLQGYNPVQVSYPNTRSASDPEKQFSNHMSAAVGNSNACQCFGFLYMFECWNRPFKEFSSGWVVFLYDKKKTKKTIVYV